MGSRPPEARRTSLRRALVVVLGSVAAIAALASPASAAANPTSGTCIAQFTSNPRTRERPQPGPWYLSAVRQLREAAEAVARHRVVSSAGTVGQAGEKSCSGHHTTRPVPRRPHGAGLGVCGLPLRGGRDYATETETGCWTALVRQARARARGDRACCRGRDPADRVGAGAADESSALTGAARRGGFEPPTNGLEVRRSVLAELPALDVKRTGGPSAQVVIVPARRLPPTAATRYIQPCG
jgi:hypothetical protein